MPNIEIPISNGAAISQSLPWSNQELEGWYLNVPENGAFGKSNLFGSQGIKPVINTGDEEINRGGDKVADIPYFINNTTLYRVNRSISDTGVETFTTTDLGTISGEGRVSLANNGVQLVIVVPEVTGYILDTTTDVLTEITDATFISFGSVGVDYVDGFFVHNASTDGNTDTFYHSILNDGLTFIATDFGAASVDPDRIRIGHVYNNKYYALGSQTIEVFDNVGGDGFVFQRREGFVIPKGVLANFSVVNYDGGFVFLGAGENEQPAIWKLADNTLSRISTTTIQDQLALFTDTEISNAFSWVSGTHGAYLLHLTVGNKTFVYDSTASTLSQHKIWHNETSIINEAIVRNRVNSAVAAYGRILVGDSVSGRIGELDSDTYTQYGQSIRRVNSTQPLTELNEEINVSTIELSVESGVGNDDVEDPQITLEISYDGGRTFGNPRARSMGKKGEFSTRCIWNQNGRLDTSAVFRFVLTDAVKPVLMKLIVWVD